MEGGRHGGWESVGKVKRTKLLGSMFWLEDGYSSMRTISKDSGSQRSIREDKISPRGIGLA